MKVLMKHVFPNFVLVSSLMFIWHKLMNKKINFKSSKLYLSTIAIMLISISNYLITNNFFKILLITVVFMICFRYMFDADIKRCIITPIYYQLIIMISEGLFIMLLVSILKLDLYDLKDQFLGNFIVNIGTAVISIIISFIPFIQTFYESIIENVNRINKKFLLIFSIIAISFANILAMITYYQIEIRLLVLINIFFTLFCCSVVFYSLKMQNNYNKVYNKYNVAINSLKDYETMMTQYRVNNHENKNLLLTIRAMILNSDKDIPKYIDSIVKEKYNDSDNILRKMNIIPSGGLRATIYSEILKIQKNKINYTLEIDTKLKTIDLIELDTNTIIDICKIIGVFIDNAIEEVEKLKNRHIGISLYVENKILNIKISNNYQNKIQVDKIFNDGYTTKGKGHGYGLALVKKIVDNNINFNNRIELTNEIFSQVLQINYKG